MSAKEPQLENFGITPKDYDLYIGRSTDGLTGWIFLTLWLISSVVVFVITRDGEIVIGAAFWVLFLWGAVAAGVSSAIVRFRRSRLLASPVGSQIKLYEEALAAYRSNQEKARAAQLEYEQAQREAERAQQEAERARQQAERERLRKLSEYWTSLSGVEFERELGILYGRLGYRVESTPRTGDEGIDLILRKDGKTTIVQCKRQNAPAGPAIARELFGSMTAFGADNGILACTGGFTRGVVEFVQGKPITLISVSEIVEMAENASLNVVEDKVEYRIERTPVCPVVGCGKRMVLRKGRYGEFWGCTGYPKCRGTINT